MGFKIIDIFKKKNHWESNKWLFHNLVGKDYDKDPENKLENIRQAKKNESQLIIDYINPKKEDVVIDLGSGFGLIAKEVSKYVKKIYCCDISSRFLKFAKKELKNIENVSFHLLKKKAPVLNFSENSIDIVYSNAVFIHLNIYDIYWYFFETKKILKKGGKFFITIFNIDNLDINDSKFNEMAGYYKKDSSMIELYTMWNSKNYIMKLANYFKFKLIKDYTGLNDWYLFISE